MSLSSPRVDHVLINVDASLDQAAEQYRRLGFTLTPRGHHSLGSSNHLAVLDNNYLELLGYELQNAPRAAGLWGKHQGLAGLVFKTQDADALFTELSQRGVALLGAPQAFHRPVELPDGSLKDARFRILHLDPVTVPSGRIFFCQHLDPDLVWRASWQQHANGVHKIIRTVIASSDPDSAVTLLARVFGDAAVQRIEGGRRLQAGPASVDYLTLDAARAQFGNEITLGENGSDRKVALALKTRSIASAKHALQQGEVPFFQHSTNEILVSANQAYGVALLLSE